jgi:DNA-directed RNA polymerase specialized sigma24 family protein
MVSFDVLTTAYAMWRDAQRAAVGRGMDDMDAAEALIRVVHFIADRFAHGTGAPIRNIRKYMFTGYVNELKRIAEKAGIVRPGKAKPKKSHSDDGDFMAMLEKAILSGQILKSLPPTEGSAAVFRYLKGYSWEETATLLGLSSGAARKALSTGLRKIFGSCMRELRELSYVEMTKAKKKR